MKQPLLKWGTGSKRFESKMSDTWWYGVILPSGRTAVLGVTEIRGDPKSIMYNAHITVDGEYLDGFFVGMSPTTRREALNQAKLFAEEVLLSDLEMLALQRR